MQSKDQKIEKALKFLKDAKDLVHRAEQIFSEADKTSQAPKQEENNNNIPEIKEPDVAPKQDLSSTDNITEQNNENPTPVPTEELSTNEVPQEESSDEIIPGLEDFSSIPKEETNKVEITPEDDEEEILFKPVEPDHDLASEVLDRPSTNSANTIASQEQTPEEQPAGQGIKELDI